MIASLSFIKGRASAYENIKVTSGFASIKKKFCLKISNLLLLKEPLIVVISKALAEFTFSKALGLLIFK